MADLPPQAILESPFGPAVWDFAWRMTEAFAASPFEVTSWWRSPARNRLVGGARFSQHLVGTAMDVVSGDRGELERALRFQGLIVVPEREHLHVQAWPAGTLERLLR